MRSTHLFLLAIIAGSWLLGCNDDTSGHDIIEPDSGSGPSKTDAATSQTDGGPHTGLACQYHADCPDEAYCDFPEDATLGECRTGCRIFDPDASTDRDNCPENHYCDEETHKCEKGCTETYNPCGGGLCNYYNYNCSDFAECYSDDQCKNAFPHSEALCDRNFCAPAFVCCDDNTCKMTTEGNCTDLLTIPRNCTENPCEARTCNSNQVCLPDGYCDGDGRCRPGCFQDSQCGRDEYCNLTTNECDRHPCTAATEATDCLDHQYCNLDTSLCEEGCRENDSNRRCVTEDPNTTCNPMTHECGRMCEPEQSTAACTTATGQHAEYCDVELHVCRLTCEAHELCGTTEYCNLVNGHCLVGCRDDLDTEPNDSMSQATSFPLASVQGLTGYRKGTLVDRRICNNNPDFYKVVAGDSSQIEVKLTFDETAADLKLKLYATLTGSSDTVVTPTGGEAIIRFPTQPTPVAYDYFYIEVSGDGGEQGVDYQLDVVVIDSTQACFYDPRDPGDNQWQGATSETPLEFDDGVYCFGDQDWFTFPMTVNDGLRVEVVTEPDSDELKFELYSESDLQSSDSRPRFANAPAYEQGGKQVYKLEVARDSGAFTNENWYLKLYGEGSASGLYSIDIKTERGDVCTNDSYEPNDSINQSFDIDANVVKGTEYKLPGLAICSGDSDFFKLQLAEKEKMTAWITKADGSVVRGTINVAFVRSNNQSVSQSSLTTTESASAQIQVSTPGEYYIKVSGQSEAEAQYTLHVLREAISDAGACSHDINEPANRNDVPDNATPMTDISNNEGLRFEGQGVMCDPDGSTKDRDWYQFPVDYREARVCVMLQGFVNSEADLNLTVYQEDETGSCCGTNCPGSTTNTCESSAACINHHCSSYIANYGRSASTNDAEMVNVPKEDSNTGDHYVMVTRKGDGADSSYQVLATVTPNTDCSNDGHENNDHSSSPTMLADHAALCDTWLCTNNSPEDVDWYQLKIPANEDRTVFIEFDNTSDGRLFLSAQGSQGTVNSKIARANGQCINVKAGTSPSDILFKVSFGGYEYNQETDHRIDYSLRVLPTNLATTPKGECGKIEGGDIVPACSGTVTDDCWPTYIISD